MGSIGRTVFRAVIGALVVTLVSLTIRQRRALAPLGRVGAPSSLRLIGIPGMPRQSGGQLGGGRC